MGVAFGLNPRLTPRFFRSLGIASVTFATHSLAPATAAAFEEEWHVGVGAGLSQPTSDYDTAPLLALHAAYGLSDAVDARATFAGSLHSAKNQKWDKATLTLGTLGLAYKLDVIEWVPYIGVRAGYFYFGPPPQESDGKSVYAKSGGSLGIMAGVDYSFTRSFAVGVELARDLLLPEGQVNSGILHAEYRFGF